MNRRALGIAIVVAILGMFLMLLYQQRFEEEASGGERVTVLQVIKQVDRGSAITDEALAPRKIPIAYLEERAVKETEKNKILGLTVANTVRAQQTLLWTDLVSGTEERKDLSQLVIPGYRGVTIRVSRDDPSVSLLQPGDYVDVIAILSATAQAEDKTATVLMQKILVLANGESTSVLHHEEGKKDQIGSESITLSLTVPEAQVLALAAEKGRLTVVVRPPGDSQINSFPEKKSKDFFEKGFVPVRGGGPTGPVNISPENK
ncbi:MAG: Flp pilus assembly protein CpaB [Polyangiaceae bacterium]|jgi:pilus assembly protein CpaB|nr:Flp pilus assembly protein CpaB [Polyangiaceae bacterium]